LHDHIYTGHADHLAVSVESPIAVLGVMSWFGF